jgi:hypothetical protein
MGTSITFKCPDGKMPMAISPMPRAAMCPATWRFDEMLERTTGWFKDYDVADCSAPDLCAGGVSAYRAILTPQMRQAADIAQS